MSQLQHGFFIVLVLLILLVNVQETNSKEHSPKKRRCPPRRYGPGCLLRCSGDCRSCDGDGVCLQCYGRRRPPACQGCQGGYFGLRCDHTCVGCDDCDGRTGECVACREPGLALPDCTRACPGGSYGQHCSHRCPLSCAESCDVRTGKCKECMHGTGASCRVDCSKAEDKYACKLYCPPKCEGICNATNGHCQDCAAGYTSLKCDKACVDGFYGKNCRDVCPKYCKAGSCDSVTGMCEACEAGHVGKECESEVQCKSGFFGEKCSKPCPHTCAEGKCSPDTGECVSCYAGYTGQFCNEPCRNGSYGVNCRKKCPANCEGVCSAKTGTCWSCVSGFLGDFCNKTCGVGTFGIKCSRRCSELCKDERCDPADGHCFACPRKRNGTFCEDVYVKEKGLGTMPIVAVYLCIGTMLPVFIVSIPMCIYKRCLRREIMRQERRKVFTMLETPIRQSPEPILHKVAKHGSDKHRPIMRNEVSFKDIYMKLKDDKFTDFSMKSTTRSEVSRSSQSSSSRHVRYNKTEVVSNARGNRDSHLFPRITITDKTGSITSINFCKSQDNSMQCPLPYCSNKVPSGTMDQLAITSRGNITAIPSASNTCIHDNSDSDSDVTLTTVEGAQQYNYKQGRSYLLCDDKLFKNGKIFKLRSPQPEDDDTQPSSSSLSDSHARIHKSCPYINEPGFDTDARKDTKKAEYPRELPDFGRGLNIDRCVLCDDPPVLRNKYSSNTEQNRSKYSLKHSRSDEKDNIKSESLRKTVSFSHTCLGTITEENRGFTPEPKTRGFTPELDPRGFTPELDPRGFTPELDPRGFTPELDPRGFTPELDPRGFTPDLDPRVFIPEQQPPESMRGLQSNNQSETDTSQWSHDTLALPSSNHSKRTKSAPDIPPRSPSTRLLSKSHQRDAIQRSHVNGLAPLSLTYSHTSMPSHFNNGSLVNSDCNFPDGGSLNQTLPATKTSHSQGKMSSRTSPNAANVVYNAIQLPSLTRQCSPTHPRKVRAALPKEVIDELQAGFTKFSALMKQVVSPHYDQNNDTHDCDAVQEPTELANSLSYLRYVQNPTQSRSAPYTTNLEPQPPLTPPEKTSSHVVAVSNDTVVWQRNNDQCEKYHAETHSDDSCHYSLCSSCEDQMAHTQKHEQSTLHTAYASPYEKNTLPVKFSHYRSPPKDQEYIEPMLTIVDSQEHDGNAIRYSPYPSISSCDKEASFHIVKGRSSPVFRQPSARQLSPKAKSSAAKLDINTDEAQMSTTGSVPKVTTCKLPRHHPGRPPPPPPPPRTSSTVKSSSTCSDQRMASISVHDQHTHVSPRPLPVPSPERMLQLQLEAEGLGGSKSEHSKSTCRSEDFTDAHSCLEADPRPQQAQHNPAVEAPTGAAAPSMFADNPGLNDVVEEEDAEGHEMHPYRAYTD